MVEATGDQSESKTYFNVHSQKLELTEFYKYDEYTRVKKYNQANIENTEGEIEMLGSILTEQEYTRLDLDMMAQSARDDL